jgi:predicted AlkP superfamily pyrophosphatase or phosphodiesterase
MNYKFFLSILIVLSVTLPLHAEGIPKSLVVMLDGARADAMRMATTPNFDSICNGSWAEGYCGTWSFATHTIKDAPTVSAPNHTAIATGVTAQKTQVANNNLYENYNKTNASATYKTFLTRIKNRDPNKSTAFLYEWKPDIALLLENNVCDFVRDDGDKINIKTIPAILEGSFESEQWKKGNDIDAMLVFIEKPDAVGHSGGYAPPGLKHNEYVKTIEETDSWVGSMLNAIKKRPNFSNENWQIIICSDHGGWISGHGSMRSDNYTVPLIISSKKVISGEMRGQPCCADVAVTVLDHFGFDVAKMKEEGLLDGSVRGKNETVPETVKPLEEGLLVYLPFDGNLENKSPQHSEPITAENRGAVIEPSGGKRNGYLAIRKSEQPQFVTLGNPKSLQFGTDENFSVAFWTRILTVQEGNPAFISNKNWTNGNHPGCCFFASSLSANNGNIIGFNIANNDKHRVDVKQIFLTLNDWWFCAVTVDRKGNVTLFAGSSDGRLFFCSESLIDENLGKSFGRLHGNINTSLSWNIGQDGTGKYKSQLNADIDELRIWNRTLNLKEIELLFKNSK